LVTSSVKLAVPTDAGVPLITPLDAFKVSPLGSDPAVTDQVIGLLPLALSVCEYAVPTTAAGNDVVRMVGAAFIVRLNTAELLP
jgi:hypothetical protein